MSLSPDYLPRPTTLIAVPKEETATAVLRVAVPSNAASTPKVPSGGAGESAGLEPVPSLAVAFVAALAIVTFSYLSERHPKPISSESPRKTLLPKLSERQKKRLPYPVDALPGARDVESPYGCIRVYEWGPEKGRKVLLIHGISTPSVALGGIAHELVGRGCRVMLFDLYDCLG
jgi:hypothetical protein